MPITEAALKAINDTLLNLDPAIQSLRNRKDFNNPAAPFNVQKSVVFFQDYRQELMNCKAKDEQSGVVTLAADTQKTVIPKINEVMLSNTALSNMGQLNMKRTIEPKPALARNVIFDKLLQSTMQLVASAHQAPQLEPPTLAIDTITYTSCHSRFQGRCQAAGPGLAVLGRRYRLVVRQPERGLCHHQGPRRPHPADDYADRRPEPLLVYAAPGQRQARRQHARGVEPWGE